MGKLVIVLVSAVLLSACIMETSERGDTAAACDVSTAETSAWCGRDGYWREGGAESMDFRIDTAADGSVHCVGQGWTAPECEITVNPDACSIRIVLHYEPRDVCDLVVVTPTILEGECHDEGSERTWTERFSWFGEEAPLRE